jgi:pyrroline-5-carboxylate reductase
MAVAPILVAGAGRMGGAIIAGWALAGAYAGKELLIRDPSPGDAALSAVAGGAQLNPGDEVIAGAATVVLAVKPQVWRSAADALAPLIAPGAVVISILAGISVRDLSGVFGDRPVARVMPTIAAAIGRGTASVFAPDPTALARAQALFGPLGPVFNLSAEDLMHAATAASGSAPAYLYAFVEALHSAGVAAGLPPHMAAGLARSTIAGAAALLGETGEDPAELRRQVTSPGGTTQAALEVLMGENGLTGLLERAVAAAATRSRELGA